MDETIYESPIGKLLIVTGSMGLAEISFADSLEQELGGSEVATAFSDECRRQLDDYFAGRRQAFDLRIDLKGTVFQLSVWRALLAIPYGATWSYGELAARVGKPKASRAVGGANHRNPVSIVVPCHRVIGSDGGLTGYGGGLWRKEWLIAHERKISQRYVDRLPLF
ncbi:MAG: methylated-DNA--[protein]-cysteine S-methyltransferase [Synergistaceae bacterium]|nr:methylated-DNA--[protein]-cysteine S-methyltransferase [Synergistaceae bacterium]